MSALCQCSSKLEFCVVRQCFSKLELVPSHLKFCSSKWFCEEVDRLFSYCDMFNANDFGVDLLSHEVPVNFKMFSLVMENKVLGNYNVAFVVTFDGYKCL